MAYCIKCGYYAADGAKVCIMCGTPLPSINPRTQPTAPAAAPQAPMQQGGDVANNSAALWQKGANAVQQAVQQPQSVRQAAQQMVQQFTGGTDIMASETQGEIVLSSWRLPTNAKSISQMGAKAVKKAAKKKGGCAWFLIPLITILAWFFNQVMK